MRRSSHPLSLFGVCVPLQRLMARLQLLRGHDMGDAQATDGTDGADSTQGSPLMAIISSLLGVADVRQRNYHRTMLVAQVGG